jgi:DNA-directed RNA polymerase subunit RPC12/RpoP
MNPSQNFVCPHCHTKLPFSYVARIKNDHEFDCPNCGETLVPQKVKSFLWGYVVGFFAMALPGQVMLYLYDDFLLALTVGALCFAVVLIAFCLYLYTNTKIVKSSTLT